MRSDHAAGARVLLINATVIDTIAAAQQEELKREKSSIRENVLNSHFKKILKAPVISSDIR